jgi:uracil phosphoribosyltransferase
LADRLLDTFGKLHGLVQEMDFPHVQGKTFCGLATATSGSTSSKSSILILPLMRGGEPMSRGVHQRFPSAQLVHWYDNGNPPPMSLEKTTDVLIVDSVVNQGRSVRSVLQYLFRQVNKSFRVYVLTGVMQKDASLTLPLDYPRVRFLALRVSENSYTGQGGTDTGNRLFMTY